MDEDLRTEITWIIRTWFPKLTISWSFSGPGHKGQQPCRRMFGYIRMPGSPKLYYSPRGSLYVSTQAPYCHVRHFKFLSNSLNLLSWVLEEEIDRLTFLQVTFLCLSFFLNKFIYLFTYFWLHWVFVAAHGLSLVAASGGYSSLWCAGFSLQWLLLLPSAVSRHSGFSSCSMWAQ